MAEPLEATLEAALARVIREKAAIFRDFPVRHSFC
jgi:hypothetical protein